MGSAELHFFSSFLVGGLRYFFPAEHEDKGGLAGGSEREEQWVRVMICHDQSKDSPDSVWFPVASCSLQASWRLQGLSEQKNIK